MRFLQFSLYTLILASTVLVTSCKDNIDFAGDHVETPVLFGLLDKNDSLHYVKLTRTFAGSNNSVNVALIEDSSYFQNAEITLEEWAFLPPNNVFTKVRSWVLRDTVLTNKVPGAFYSPNQKVYYFQTQAYNSLNQPSVSDQNLAVALKDEATYRLIANINGGQIVVNGETKLVTGMSVSSPSSNGNYSFVKTVSGVKEYNGASLKSNNGNAQVIDARIQFFFNEYYGSVPVEKSFIWKVGELNGDEIQGTASNFSANGETFYQLVKQNCTNDPSITKRQMTSIRLIMTGGSADLSKYILVNQPSSSLAQNKPSFTNLSRADGGPVIGLFSSRMTTKQDKEVFNSSLPNQRALDYLSNKELCSGPITGLLLFCSSNPIDISNGESWACQ
ncbi:hypothetical protein [Fluviicola sp.]|jgi:hypothetical protein|uniref:hypothetical protein n=1 Tax=Fluviicola sp. TaxID=1917219 RepID=UPI00281D2F38|nr:hypothetical protein [Fluviicola sp.]MDR0802186.1 hypothetical protein [Fluviicola sp.]